MLVRYPEECSPLDVSDAVAPALTVTQGGE